VEPTALQAYASASELAEEWQADAQLIGARAHCLGDVVTHGGQVEWAFQFFSPATQRVTLLATRGGQVRQIRERLSPYAVSPLRMEEWQVDSDEALDRWWQEGGDYLVTRRSDAEVTMRLYTPRGGPDRPVWTITGSVPNQESPLVVQVDASDGAILDR
jgi:hypothetical protein